jgi:hypothetical protein
MEEKYVKNDETETKFENSPFYPNIRKSSLPQTKFAK